MKKTLSRLLAAALVLAMVCAMIPAAMATVSAVSIGTGDVAMTVGQGENMTVTYTSSDAADDKTIVWKAYDAATGGSEVTDVVAFVPNGAETTTVSALRIGTVYIQASVGGVESARRKVDVKCCTLAGCTCTTHAAGTACTCTACTAIQSITASKTTLALTAGTDEAVTFTANYAACSQKPAAAVAATDLNFVSSAPTVATFDAATGKIKAVADGTARITASLKTNSNVYATVDVTVSSLVVSGITAASNRTYTKGDAAAALTVTVTPAGTYTYQWYKANGASPDNAGTAITTATTNTYTPSTAAVDDSWYYCKVTSNGVSKDSARAHIKVVEPAYTITLTKSPTGTVEIDDSVALTARVLKKSDSSNATGTVTFSVSGSAVTLSASSAALTSGTAAITAYASKAGSSTVTATYSSGSTSYTASVSITVAEATSGDVEYYVDAEETVELDESDFQDFFEKTYKNGELSYVTFSTGSAKNYGTSSYGYLYESSDRRADKVQSRTKYYYNTTSNKDLNSI